MRLYAAHYTIMENANDIARLAIRPCGGQSMLKSLHLVDYKVRILNGGTEAVTRVLIESADTSGERWFTVGVSPNIVEASFDALHDAITFKLFRDGAKAV